MLPPLVFRKRENTDSTAKRRTRTTKRSHSLLIVRFEVIDVRLEMQKLPFWGKSQVKIFAENIDHDYIGYNYLDHDYIGRNYVDNDHVDHNYVDHGYIGRN